MTQLEEQFRIRRIVTRITDNSGLRLDPERAILSEWEDHLGQKVVQCAIDIVTQETPIIHFPRDWWQHFKLRWFPKWAQKKTPIKMIEVIAVHKFPELQPPQLGREFVTLRFMEYDDYLRMLDERKITSEDVDMCECWG